ncbi:MAG: ArnT family glycosyltransferase [Planctomycetota bacterium]
MSRAAREKRRPPAPEGVLRRHKTQDTRHKTQGLGLGSGVWGLVIIAILVAIPFSMGKYFEFNSPGAYDSGANVYSAKHILDGAEIGVEEKHSASLGTLLVNILGVWLCGFNETGPKLAQTILQAAALVLMFIAMRKLFGSLPAAVGVIIASVYLSSPLIAKFGNVKEQYMIACMVMGISCFVLYQLGGKWWLAFLAGAFVSWAPLFKQTGVSAIGAIGLFIVLQPLLKNRTPKQTGLDILLLLSGAAATIGPLYVWIIAGNVRMTLPYSFVWETLGKFLPVGADSEPAKTALDYVAGSRKLVSFSQQWPIVLRYYGLLILPITLAVGSIIIRIVKMISGGLNKSKSSGKAGYDRFVLLFAVWWVLDMAFVWISPRSYEQYYLPLNASAAMLGGYLIAVYYEKAKSAASRPKWVAIGLLGFLAMIIMSWHIFFGIKKSPYSGRPVGEKYKGYAQKFQDISLHSKYPWEWERVGEYIRANSKPTDKIYVWGWVPGIYVSAQRFSSASKAFSMPRPAPPVLAELVATLICEFEKEMPKFIVDTRKRHIPTIRPPYELWPIVVPSKEFKDFMVMEKAQLVLDERTQIAFEYLLRMEKPQFLPLNKNVIEMYDKAWSQILRASFDEDEALRYEALQPFREFVMENYRIVRLFGNHVLFELKSPTVNEERQ